MFELKQISEAVMELRIAFAALNGKYEESSKLYQNLMDFRNHNEKFLKDCKNEKSEMKDMAFETIKKLEEKSNETHVNTQTTYASAVKSITGNMQQFKKDTKVILFYSREENRAQTSEETNDKLQSIKPVQHGIKINRIAKIRNGGVALEVHKDHAQVVVIK